MEKLITVSDAAAQLGVTKKTLQVWDREGKLTALRTAGGHQRYRQSDIEKLQGIEHDDADRNLVVVIECVDEVFPKSFENELVEDMLSLLSSFSSKIYGKRSAENRRKKKEAEQK